MISDEQNINLEKRDVSIINWIFSR